MYTFEFYDKKLHITDDNDLFLISPVINMGVNKSWTVTAQIQSIHPYFPYLQQLKYGLKVKKDGKVIFRGRITEFKQDFNNIYSIYVEDKMAALNDSPCRPYEFAGSPEELFEWFLNNHNSQVGDEQKLLKGNVDIEDPNNYIARSWEKQDTTWNLMNSRLLDTLGGYFVIRYEDDGDYLDWVKGFDIYANQKIEFGENLVDVEKLIDATETYTACIPYGAEIEIINYSQADEAATWEPGRYYTHVGDSYIPIKSETEFNSATTIYEISSRESTGERVTIEEANNGIDYIINNERAELYGIIYAPDKLVTWDDVTVPNNLLAKATAWLNNEGIMLKESISLSAVDLAMAGVNINEFKMYQNVKVVSEPHGINTSYLVTDMKIAADMSEVLKISIGGSKRTLSSQTINSNKESNAVREKVENIEKKYVTNEKVASEIINATSQILQTAENITLGILSGYTTVSDLEEYKNEISNLFKVTQDGFSFEFNQLEERINEVGSTIVEQNQYIRLVNGEIIIGRSDSPIISAYTNDALEFRYNGVTVARFTNEVLEVRNINVDNQLRLHDRWAFRRGEYQTGKGYNLNVVWLG